MTSRERVLAVLNGEKADRIPNGLGATINTAMHLLAYDRLRTLPGVEGTPARMMSFEANALFDRELNKRGRYIFAGVHNLQWNVPESHLLAILSALDECRGEEGA